MSAQPLRRPAGMNVDRFAEATRKGIARTTTATTGKDGWSVYSAVKGKRAVTVLRVDARHLCISQAAADLIGLKVGDRVEVVFRVNERELGVRKAAEGPVIYSTGRTMACCRLLPTYFGIGSSIRLEDVQAKDGVLFGLVPE